jgi:hypothetical protein
MNLFQKIIQAIFNKKEETMETLTSVTDNVRQDLFWDPKTMKIEVNHMINMSEYLDARWIDVHTYSSEEEEDKYKEYMDMYANERSEAVEEFKNSKKGYITVFNYKEVPGLVPTPHAQKFPENGSYYPLSGIPHMVVANLDKSTPTGSKTSTAKGIAL